MKNETKLIHIGRNPKQHSGSVNPPIYQTSTIVFSTLEDYKKANKGIASYEDEFGDQQIDCGYGITGTPTTFALQKAISELEGSDYSWIVPSGLSAISTAILSFVESGDHILVADTVYGPTRRFCNKSLKKLGVETEYYDPLIGSNIKKLIRKNTRLIFLESPGSLTFEMQDVPAITKVARSNNIITIIDNSWATPLYYQPLKNGCDVSIQAITKYISGHADILLGSISANKKHQARINSCYRNYGIHVSPYACSQVLRGLRTLDVRLKRHEESALKVSQFLESHKKVTRVLYPPLPSDPGYKLWKRDFSGANGLLSFVLDKEYKDSQIAKFINKLKYFSIGSSWGGYESLIVHFDPRNEVRSVTNWRDNRTCIRIHVGLENSEDLIKDLETGLKRL
mgnify:FL=1